jgi:site-specific DNA recombinase
MLNRKVIQGTHEKLITPELFLQIHNIRSDAGGKYGVPHKKENDEYPLNGYTGYVVKKKEKATGKPPMYYY